MLGFLRLLVGVLYLAFGIGCVIAVFHWSAVWPLIGLALYGGIHYGSRRERSP